MLREAQHQLVQPERGDLGAIGVRIETETAGGRQPRAGQGGEIRSLGSDALGPCLIRGSERNDEFSGERHEWSSASWPDLFGPSTPCVGEKDVDGRDKHGHDEF